MPRYYAEGVKHSFIQEHTWLSMVPYFVKKLNKVKKVNATSIIQVYQQILKEKEELQNDIRQLQQKMRDTTSMDEIVKLDFKMDDLKYSALTYGDDQFYELRQYFVSILKQTQANLIRKTKHTHDDNKVLMSFQLFNELDNTTAMDTLVMMKNHEVDIKLPYKEVYRNIQMAYRFQYGTKR